MQIKKSLKKAWDFIWYDDGIWSWLLNVFIAFVMIKYVVYPVLGFLLATPYPIVAVVSGSMEHAYAPQADLLGNYAEYDGKYVYALCDKTYLKEKEPIIALNQYVDFDGFWQVCGSWYENIGITKEQFSQFNYNDGFNTGDIMILYGTKAKDLQAGDILVFKTNRPDPIIHRIVKKEIGTDGKITFQTKGDHNARSHNDLLLSEMTIKEDEMVGEAVFRVPLLGYVKIAFVKFIMLWR